jgi:hypothetical protein
VTFQRRQGQPLLANILATFLRKYTIKSLIINLESHFKVLDIQQDVFFAIAIILDAL